MEANINSFTAKLYRWFYFKYQMPENLCPYFWQCVWMYLTIIPYSIMSLPFILFPKLEKPIGVCTNANRPFMGMISYFVLFCIGCMGFTAATIWTASDAKIDLLEPVYLIGFVWWAALFIVGLIGMMRSIIKSGIIKKLFQPKVKLYAPRSESIIISFVKAKYNKYCPKIEWKYKESN